MESLQIPCNFKAMVRSQVSLFLLWWSTSFFKITFLLSLWMPFVWALRCLQNNNSFYSVKKQNKTKHKKTLSHYFYSCQGVLACTLVWFSHVLTDLKINQRDSFNVWKTDEAQLINWIDFVHYIVLKDIRIFIKVCDYLNPTSFMLTCFQMIWIHLLKHLELLHTSRIYTT